MSTNSDSGSSFNGLRGVLWPIHNYEIKKFLPMCIMMMGILFNYTVLRDTKDTLIQFAPGGGAGSFAFLKLYCVTPAAVLFMIIFAKMANSLSKEKLFYAVLLPFLVFFVLFGFIIYPNRELLHMTHVTITNLQGSYPSLHWFIPIIGNWSFALFYILSELWGSVILSMLFWQFANEITKVEEAKRFYGMFGLIGNVGLLFSGWAIMHGAAMSKAKEALGVDTGEAWGDNIRFLMSAIMISGVIICWIYYWMNRKVLTDPLLYDPALASGNKKKNKPKLSLWDSCKYIFSSKYLGLILVIVMAYGIGINLVEGVWKTQIKVAYPNPNDYNHFMGLFSAFTGSTTILLMIAGNNILRRTSWKTASLITPLMVLISSILFFGFIMYSKLDTGTSTIMGFSVVMLSVIIGAIQNILSKGTKYSLFDSTKQMAYIPLDTELKVKGQAAVEVIGGRAGKSGGALIISTLLMSFGGNVTPSDLAHILGVIVIVIALTWIWSVTNLSKLFESLKLQRAAENTAV